MRALISTTLILLSLGACGLKGPLYLPQPEEASRQPIPAPTTEIEKK